MNHSTLLAPDEPAPVLVENEHARSPYVIVCDHASKSIPRALGDLGLPQEELSTHIAWDIGAAEVARHLAHKLDAVLFLQQYSRLVIDCNRPLSAPDSIPELTGGVQVPGNHALSPEAVQGRVRSIFKPYHDRIGAVLKERGPSQPHILIAMHSFTPVLYDVVRPYHAGVLYYSDGRLALPLLKALRADSNLVVGENEPYAADAKTDYSIIEHAENGRHPYVEIEVRQDLICDSPGQIEWAQRLAQCLQAASSAFPF